MSGTVQSKPVNTILVVDDELGNAEILAMILTEEGYRAIAATNGVKALELARQHVPDVAFVDYMMPIVNGPTLIRRMKADAAFAKTRFILNSGLSEESIRREFTDYDAFLRKPFKFEAVMGALEALKQQQAPGETPSD